MSDQRIDQLVRHIMHVQQNCILLGNKLIDQGDEELGRGLIANGLIHDNSKFRGIEWEVLSSNDAKPDDVNMVIRHHSKTNLHHPEYWPGGIKSMPLLYLCECVCDWKARSTEFGTGLTEWINSEASKRFGFQAGDDVHAVIMKLVGLMLEQPFGKIKTKRSKSTKA